MRWWNCLQKGWFHQHFTHAFFLQKCFLQLFSVTFGLNNFLDKMISSKKSAWKMLMKLTQGVNSIRLFSTSKKSPAHIACQKIWLSISPTIDSPGKLTMCHDFMLIFLLNSSNLCAVCQMPFASKCFSSKKLCEYVDEIDPFWFNLSLFLNYSLSLFVLLIYNLFFPHSLLFLSSPQIRVARSKKLNGQFWKAF